MDSDTAFARALLRVQQALSCLKHEPLELITYIHTSFIDFLRQGFSKAIYLIRFIIIRCIFASFSLA